MKWLGACGSGLEVENHGAREGEFKVHPSRLGSGSGVGMGFRLRIRYLDTGLICNLRPDPSEAAKDLEVLTIQDPGEPEITSFTEYGLIIITNSEADLPLVCVAVEFVFTVVLESEVDSFCIFPDCVVKGLPCNND